MTYLETSASGILLVYYLASSVCASIRLPASRIKASSSQKNFLLVTTVLALVVSIGLCCVQGVNAGSVGRHADDGLLSDLIYALQWMVLIFAHIDHPDHVRYPHFGTWALSIPARLYVLLDRVPTTDLLSQRIYRTLTVFILLQIVLATVLLTTVVMLRCQAPDECSAQNDGETQPLLSCDQASNQTKSGEDPDEDERENDERKKARQELHNRPLREYLKSFGVYIPVLLPRTLQQQLCLGGMLTCMLLLRVVTILQPLALGLIIDTLARGDAPWLPIVYYFVLYFLGSRTGLALVQEYLHLVLTNQQTLKLKKVAYDHVMDLSADFHDTKTSSEIWQAMAQAQSVIDLSHEVSFGVLPMLIDLVSGTVLLFTIFGPYMGYLVGLLMVLIVWVAIKAIKSRVRLNRTWRDSWYDAYRQMVDSTENWYTVAQFGQFEREKETYYDNQRTVVAGRNKLYYWYLQISMSRFSILTFAYLAAVGLAAWEIHNNELEVGAFVTLSGYWGQVSSPIMYIVHELTTIADKLVDAEKLLVLLEQKPTIVDLPDAVDYVYQGGAVAFNNVTFTYDGKKQAAEDVTFEAKPGQMTALVGETGGGKSTILKLLMRFYDPEKGQIEIDGQILANVRLDSFRKHVAVVPQDPSMFHSTILENVRYADPSISQVEVEEACKAVSLHDKILTFKKGYLTKVGERGCQLSGGEKQRLAIARAILKQPNILLLDEATSSVDSVTEALIQASLDLVCKNRTSFVIAHRLSTIMKADQILVLEGGKIMERGTHQDLLQRSNGAYRKLWDSQLKIQERSSSTSPTQSGNRGRPTEDANGVVDTKESAC
jgi:ABC-type multidrug transport system fused ATPase/permease subunit